MGREMKRKRMRLGGWVDGEFMKDFLGEYKRHVAANRGKRVSKSAFLQEILQEAVKEAGKKRPRNR
jgi:hypothetical protein